ncbi:MAG: OmpA family protein [Verrucomicrobiae bacterium]|nr:OmpA family protein [Verrucomicrobiae bacterium]NNJ43407.1 OmpA family protein [Akkermansiaceae bacterium]
MDTNEDNAPTYTPLEPADHQPTPQPAKSSGNQLTTALIVIIVVILFAMLMLSMNRQPHTSTPHDGADLAALEAKNTQLRADANAERIRQGLPPLPDDSRSARMLADRIQRDSMALTTLASQWQDELGTKDVALNDLHSQITSRDENTKRLYSQIASLQAQLNQLGNAPQQLASASHDLKMANSQIASLQAQLNQLGNAPQQLASASHDLKLANTQVAALQAQLNQLGDAPQQLASVSHDLKAANNQIANYRKQLAEFQGRPSSEEVTSLRKQLNDNMVTRNKLQLQIDTLLEQTKHKIDQSQYDEAIADLAHLRPEIVKQRYEIQRLRSQLDRSSLFIESENDLPADAARLFAKLRALDSVQGATLAAAYKHIEQTLGARVIHRQTYTTGSSQIAFDRETMIKNAMHKGTGAQSFFLVVGYASNTGDAASNQKISAARATTAASVVNLFKTEQQQVRAVYLGQTNRFSQDLSAENQICEVWEIKK